VDSNGGVIVVPRKAKRESITKANLYRYSSFDGEVFPFDRLDAAINGNIEKIKAPDLPGFIDQHSKDTQLPEILACTKALKSQYKEIEAIGYCWGEWACFQLGAKGRNLIDCVTVAHSSHLEHSEIVSLAVHTQILAPETDRTFSPELMEYCNKIIPGLGMSYQYDYYPGLVRDFAAKGDNSDPA
jgi:dienelactone hydrolase